ncbi:HAD-IC family P-type ATPase [Oerskovia paurometabola]|uniref:HAD-IC family P-type ATPase n=1 Tax=Oerskovia paurometabola TaxID=162170 RepID=A0ABW1XA59_9CELL|nr:HAD-IC family P-type ATPase [Oerskovia paurometabola]MBM7497582.1 cation-transporting ATPase E [Oerskovia paurometabola]
MSSLADDDTSATGPQGPAGAPPSGRGTGPQDGTPASRPGAEPGLSAQEVAARVRAGQTNLTTRSTSRSLTAILRSNVFTLFNLILAIAVTLVLLTGRWPDAVFGFVVVINAAIGIVTEYRAKRTLDRLSILTAPYARVVRDGTEQQVALDEVVLDDVLLVGTGDQVPADARVLDVTGLEVDESMLTGESRPVRKAVGDEVLSGSAVVAGAAVCRVVRVGEEGYAQRITSEAKKFSVVRSELREGVNKILKVVSIGIVPISLLLFWSQLYYTGGVRESIADGTWRDGVVAAVAGVVGMIPEGLVLLTSLNFAIAATLLARQKVLVQELPAVEILARVDVLCLDKTGTLTDGHVALTALRPLAAVEGAREALAALAADPDGNATSKALAEGLADTAPAAVAEAVPFSSARKWSAVRTGAGAFVLGAPEILLAGRTDGPAATALAEVHESAGTGARVVLLAHAPTGLPTAQAPLPSDLAPALLAVLGERIRPDAAQTLEYFRRQGTRAKVISGDNPDTVAAIATSVGLHGEGVRVEGFDARELPTDPDELADVVAAHDVYGRVTPEQKRAIVHALQSRGHVVGMTGDGVNDALALKDADLGIAMGNGAPATKAVARVVLVDGRFATLPGVLGQGRRVMANMERVASLFLAKTTYAAILAVSVVLLVWPYPFLPRHMTLAGSLTIGIPAFFLALPPNDRRYLAGFLRRVLSFAIPAGVVIGAVILAVYGYLRPLVGTDDARSAATLVLIGVSLWIVGIQARPVNGWKIALIAALAACAALAVAVPWVRDFFALQVPTASEAVVIAIAVVVGWVAIEAVYRVLTPRLGGGSTAGRAKVDILTSR